METTPTLPSLETTDGGAKRSVNRLNRMQDSELIAWMRQEENTAFVAKETDKAAAIKAAADLGFPITAANITGTRNALNIPKLRPAAPEPTDPSLADLQRRFLAAENRIEALQVKATSMDELLTSLRTTLSHAEARLTKLERTPDLTAAPFNG